MKVRLTQTFQREQEENTPSETGVAGTSYRGSSKVMQ